MSESVWSKEAPPSAILPPTPAGGPHPQLLGPLGPAERLREGRPNHAGSALRILVTVGVAAAVGSAVTYLITGGYASPPAAPQTVAVSPSPTPPTPQFSSTDVAGAKENLCHVFDVSVRGQEGQGGVRVAGGGVNAPMVLRALNSASAVQNTLVPAVPPDVASAARKYIDTTLDQTTAAMGNTPTSEVNRLTDVRNDAINALVDACGLPR